MYDGWGYDDDDEKGRIMNKWQMWLDTHPVSAWLLNKFSDFLWFFAKFSVCVLIWTLIFILKG